MVIGQSQCFLIALVLSAAVGARRGWNREVITCAIVLGTVLFLLNGGADMLNTFIVNLTQHVGGTASAAALSGGTTGTTSGGGAPAYAATTGVNGCTPISNQTLGTLIFGGMSYLGYRTDSKYGPPPKLHTHRIAGTIPGAVNGASMAYYLSHGVLTGNKQLLLFSPSGTLTSSYLPQIFGVGLIGLLVVLFIAGQTSKSSK